MYLSIELHWAFIQIFWMARVYSLIQNQNLAEYFRSSAVKLVKALVYLQTILVTFDLFVTIPMNLNSVGLPIINSNGWCVFEDDSKVNAVIATQAILENVAFVVDIVTIVTISYELHKALKHSNQWCHEHEHIHEQIHIH